MGDKMRRGTTPTLEIEMKGIDISELSGIYITIRQGDVEITKDKDQIEIKDGNMILVWLSQEDTLKFVRGYAWVQLRATTNDGLAVASTINRIPVDAILKDGVIS